jgi:hypothetical protein
LNGYEVAPRRPILLATSSTIDVGVDALAEVGTSELLRTHRSALNSRPRWRAACCLARYERNTISDI